MISGAVKWLLLAMAAVESQGDPNVIGDGGRAIGTYQIHWEYWYDTGEAGTWEDCKDPAYAEKVIVAYWKRYCPDALKRGDLEVLARIHNGGPEGNKKRQTAKYWRKIKALAAETARNKAPPSDDDAGMYRL